MKFIVQMARDQAREDNNGLAMLVLCCVQCIISCFEDLLQYFNHYAFTQVAIYGKDYCDAGNFLLTLIFFAGKSTWELIKYRGLEAVINDNLIGFVLNIGGLFIAIISGVIGYFYGLNQMNGTDGGAIIGAIVCLLISLSIYTILCSVIDSGTAATYVCIAEDPASKDVF